MFIHYVTFIQNTKKAASAAVISSTKVSVMNKQITYFTPCPQDAIKIFLSKSFQLLIPHPSFSLTVFHQYIEDF